MKKRLNRVLALLKKFGYETKNGRLAIYLSEKDSKINLDNIDPACDPKLDFVPNVAKERKINYAASNSFGFGGHNCCLVVGRV